MGRVCKSFPLHAVIPPSDLCQFLILIRHGLRRNWAVIGSTPSVQLSIEAARYLVNELYRSIMPWYASIRPLHNQHFVHVHVMTYYEDADYDALPDHDALLDARVRESAAVLISYAPPVTRILIIRSNHLWGGYFPT